MLNLDLLCFQFWFFNVCQIIYKQKKNFNLVEGIGFEWIKNTFLFNSVKQ